GAERPAEPVRSSGLFDSPPVTSSPEYSGWILVDLIKQLGEARRLRQGFVGVPAPIAVLTVQPPHSLGADVLQLRDLHLTPLVWWMELWPLFEQNHLVAFDTKPYTELVTNGRWHARVAERRKLLRHLSLVDLRQRHLPSPS